MHEYWVFFLLVFGYYSPIEKYHFDFLVESNRKNIFIMETFEFTIKYSTYKVRKRRKF